MTEPDNNPEFDPSTDSDAPVEETPDAPVQEPTPTEVTPEAPEVHDHEVGAPQHDPYAPELDSAPVSGVPTPGAVSDEDQVNPAHEEDDYPESQVGDEVDEASDSDAQADDEVK